MFKFLYIFMLDFQIFFFPFLLWTSYLINAMLCVMKMFLLEYYYIIRIKIWFFGSLVVLYYMVFHD